MRSWVRSPASPIDFWPFWKFIRNIFKRLLKVKELSYHVDIVAILCINNVGQLYFGNGKYIIMQKGSLHDNIRSNHNWGRIIILTIHITLLSFFNLIKSIISLLECITNWKSLIQHKMPRPGLEPGLLRPQRRVLTTRRSRLVLTF